MKIRNHINALALLMATFFVTHSHAQQRITTPPQIETTDKASKEILEEGCIV